MNTAPSDRADDDPLPVWQTALIWGAALVLAVLVIVGIGTIVSWVLPT
jgi:hypothetical protein